MPRSFTNNSFLTRAVFCAVLLPGFAAAQDDDSSKKTTTIPTPPSGVEMEIGIGSRIGGPSISNYQSTNGILSLTNLGRATPQLLTGLGFNPCAESTTTNPETGLCSKPVLRHIGAFASVQFVAGSNQSISGYSVGITYEVGSHLRLLTGFSLTPVDEISHGFANAAAQYVMKNPALFPGVNPSDLASRAYGAFDGIQTTATAPAEGTAPGAAIYYPGAVTETHYRGGFLIGIALPIDIFNLFSGSKASGQ